MSSRSNSGAGIGRDDQVDLLHGWGEESEMMTTLSEGFDARHPQLSLNSIGVSNVSLETKRRILTENSPDIWASWVGPELGPYHNASVLGDMTDVWTESDMERSFHETAREAVTFGDAYRGVPLNIQRTNVLFYNVELVEEANVDPNRLGDPHDFIEILGQVDDAIDEHAFVMGFIQPFASQGLYMWEGLYLGLHDSDAYRDLVEGNASRRRSEIREALSVLDQLFEHANDDAINITEGDEDERFVGGEAAFRMQGMWSGLSLGGSDMEYGTEWDQVAQPGTEGTHVINMDGFTFSSEGKHPEAAKKFLGYAGSADGIERFNKAKKSIPPRTDVSLDPYPPFVQEHARDFRRADSHLPSIAHGLGVTPERLIDLEIAFSEFIADRDLEESTRELVAIFDTIE